MSALDDLQATAYEPAEPPAHEHCWHVFAQPWLLDAGSTKISVLPRICCGADCGRLSVLYNGIVEPGHGPFVEFNPPQALMVAPPGLKIGRA